ncbi:MAG: chorismate lyase [Mariprofundaceae bacterium]|nr:chorismate lyase [Mariprofundaceae bacterium]
MFFGSLTGVAWEPVRHWHAAAHDVPVNMAAVLTVAGSLTRFLERHHGIRLAVELHDQLVDKALPEEAELLACAVGAPALRRQVSLLHRGSVMFDAESVLPLDTLPADLMQDLQAGEKPLGNLLLDRGLSLSRSDLSVARIEAGDDAACWARRSVLRSESGTRALVVEVFRPAMWKRIGIRL